MQLNCRCQGQKCRYARGMQRRQSSGGNLAREALVVHWPRPAAPLIIAALASAQFQRSGTRTQSVASPVCKRREQVGHPIWQPWHMSCGLSSFPLPLLAVQPNLIRIVQGHAVQDQCFLWLQHPQKRSRFEDVHGLKGSPRLFSPRLIRTSGREGSSPSSTSSSSSAFVLCRQHPCSKNKQP